MTATMTDVAQAVADEIDAETWSLAVTAERRSTVQYTLEELETLRVPVIAVSTDSEQFTRGSKVTIVEVDIGVMKKLDAIDNSGVDPYVELAEEIAAYFHQRRLPGLTRAMCTVSRPDPAYDIEDLEKARYFKSILRLEFRVYPS